jgi:3-hydroxyisobutyrate dehydrogenase-like beta-hydroxyacid dehydrogenase
MSSVGVIGLGAMARPIARNLLAAGLDVIVWNRSPGPIKELTEAGARAASSPAEVFSAGIVFSMLSDDAAVNEVLLDHALLKRAPRGSVHVNMSTVSPGLARKAVLIHEEHSIGYLSAPVFGQVSVAVVGGLNVLVAGRTELIDRVQPFFDIIGSRTWRLGDKPEQANIVKIVGNYLIACTIQSLGEAVSLAETKGVDALDLVELLVATLFPGRIYASYGEKIAKRLFQPAGFTTILGRKDLLLALDAANESRLQLPVGEVLRSVFEKTLKAGHAQDDWSVISDMQPRPQQLRSSSPSLPS